MPKVRWGLLVLAGVAMTVGFGAPARGQTLVSVTLSPTTVVGGNNSTGTITLSAPAPAGGAVVTLASSNTAVATVPASATVTAGATTRTFTVTTLGVAATSPVTISGTYASVTQNASLTVNAAVLNSITIDPNSVVGGASRTASAVLNGKAPPGGAVVTLSSSNVTVAAVPANVSVAAGATTATFSITTTAVASNTTVTITGIFGATRTANITVTPATVLYSLTRSPTSVVGGNPSTGTVTLNGVAPAGGAAVALSSSNTAAATVPASLTVPAGATSKTFVIDTRGVGSSTSVTITATYLSVNKTAALTITAAVPSTLTVSPTSVPGTQPGTGTVRLTGEAPPAGAVVTLSSNNPAAVVAASVTVPGGAAIATFPITTTSVASTVSATLTATIAATSRTAALEVTPASSLISVATTTTTSLGGQLLAGVVTLNGPAPAGGATVTLTSSSTARATVPANVAVTAGATTAGFTITTKTVASSGATTLTAAFAGVNRTFALTVTPALVLISLTADPPSVAGATPSSGTVLLNGPAPVGGSVVTLSSSSGAAVVPASVTVPAGAVSASFSVTTSAQNASVTATLSAVFAGVTRTATLGVTPEARLSKVTLDRDLVVGGATATATVTLSGPAPAGGASVRLSSSNPASGTVPPTVTVNAGQISATFTVTTTTTSVVRDLTVGAAYSGVLGTATLTAAPAALVRLVGISPVSIVGGNSATVTVTLSAAAPAGGTAVSLSSSDAAATPPATITVAAGATAGSGSVATAGVASSTPVEIHATAGGRTRRGGFRVLPANLLSVTLSPSTVVGGTGSTATATLDGKAPPLGAVVTLSSSNTAVATVQANVTIAAGATSATFPVTTFVVAANTNVTIGGTYASVTRNAILTVTPAAGATLTSVTVNPTSVVGSNPSTGTATLTAAAPAGGAVVTLSSSNTAAATVPASVTVSAGSTSATFQVTTLGVAANANVTITGTYGVARMATLTVTPAALSTITLNPTSVSGGSPSTGTATLTGAAPPAGSVVTLSSSNTPVATVPPNVTIPSGATSATFTVSTVTVASSTNVTITGTYLAVPKTAVLTVVPAATLTSLSLFPTSVLGGVSSTGTVTLSSAAPGLGVTVTLSSSNTSVATVPGSVTVPAGSTTATFPVSTLTVASNATSTITASYSGTNRTQLLTVTAGAALNGVAIAPGNVVGGAGATGTVTLTAAAPAGGAPIPLSSPNPGVASVPPSVTVPAGATSATFPVTSSAVTASTSVIVAANFGGRSRTARIWVTPHVVADLLNFSVTPTTIASGDTLSATVTLTGPAPPLGAVVTINGYVSSGYLVLPPPLTIPAGQSSLTFPIPTKWVGTTTPVQIAAQFGASSRLIDLTLTPAGVTPTGVSVNPTTVTCCTTPPTGTVTMSGPAPTGGANVLLAISAPFDPPVSVPASVLVPAGATQATFPFTFIKGVGSATSVTVFAGYGGVNRTTNFTVNPGSPAALFAIKADHTDLNSGATSLLRAYLTGPAPAGGAYVVVTSSASTVAGAADINIPANAITASVTLGAGTVTVSTPATITGTYNGTPRTVNVNAHPLGVGSLSFDPSSTSFSTMLTVALRGKHAGPVAPEITLTSSDPALLTLPGAIAGGGLFGLAAKGVSSSTPVTVTAECGNNALSAVLTVLPANLVSMSLGSHFLGAGASAIGTVTLDGRAPPGGAQVSLATADSGSLAVPLDVTVAEGQTAASFVYFAPPDPPMHMPVTVTASYRGVTKLATVGVLPNAVASLSIEPESLTGGLGAVGTVVLYNPAPAGGATVALSTSDFVASVPGSVLVPENATSATFPISTGTVSSPATANISASYGGGTRSAPVTVTPAGVASLTLTDRNVVAGATVFGTITLHQPAPAGGALVTLSSSVPAAASVPANILVPAGLLTAGFQIGTASVAGFTTATISATNAGTTQTALLTVSPPLSLFGLTLAPGNVASGGSVTATIVLSGPASASGTTVTLSSSHPSVAPLPPSALISAGLTTSVPITIPIGTVASNTTVTLTASSAGVNRTGTLSVTPGAALDSFSFTDIVRTGPFSQTNAVRLNGPAPAGGAVVALSSSDTSAATVPATTTVAAGATTSPAFNVTLLAVSTLKTVTLTATYSGVSRTAQVTVAPGAVLTSLFAPSPLEGITNTNGTVGLTTVAPAGGASVTLSSSNPSIVSVLSPIVVLTGQVSANVPLTIAPVTVAGSATITASYGGVTRQAVVQVNPTRGTIVSGGILSNLAWTRAGSPYLVTSNVTVTNLTIEPGVTVLFGQTARLEVMGSLRALGTAAEPISLSSMSGTVPGSWDCLKVHQASAEIRNMIVTYAGGPGFYGLRCATGIWLSGFVGSTASATLENVTVSQTNGGGIQVNTNATIKDSIVEGNSNGGIFVNGSLSLTGSILRSNGLYALNTVTGGRITDLTGTIATGNTFDGIGYTGQSVSAATISGNETWVAGLPWIPRLPVLVDGTLTLKPGTVVRPAVNKPPTDPFFTNIYLHARVGKIIAAGTADAPILFDSITPNAAPGAWGCVRIDGVVPGSRFEHVTVANGGGNSRGLCSGALHLTKGGPALDHVAVARSSSAGIYAAGGNATMSFVDVSASGGVGLDFSGLATATVTDSTFTVNSGGGIRVGNSAGLSLTDVNLTNNGSHPILLQATSQLLGIVRGTISGNGLGAKDSIGYSGGILTGPEVWRTYAGMPWDLLGTASVSGTGVLTIEPGTLVRAAPNGEIFVSGTGRLVAVGTPVAPITITSATTPPAPGSWRCITFNVNTAPSEIAYSTIRFGGGGTCAGLISVANSSPSLRYLNVGHSSTAGIHVNLGSAVLDHITIANTAQSSIGVTGTGTNPTIRNVHFLPPGAGITNATPANVITARLNYWGSPNGPSSGGTGTGQSVSSGVIFEPWLTAAPSDPHFFSSFAIATPVFNPAIGGTTVLTFGSSLTGNWTARFLRPSDGAVVRTLSGSGSTAVATWNGRDGGGAIQPNGTYRYELDSVTGSSQNAARAAGFVRLEDAALAITNLRATPPAFSPNGDAQQETTTLTGTVSLASASWTIHVKTAGGTSVRTSSGTGTTISYVWDGKNGSGAVQLDGNYTFEVTATAGASTAGASTPVIIDTQPAQAAITSPTAGQVLSNVPSGSKDFVVVGSANDPALASWILDYGLGASPTVWVAIQSGLASVVNATLGTWATASLTNGTYTLRLRVSDQAGATVAVLRTVTLGHFDVSASVPEINGAGGGTVTLTSVVPFALNETLVIKNAAGNVVRTLFNGARPPGTYTDVWNGRNDASVLLPDGPYYFVATVVSGGTLNYDLTNQFLTNADFFQGHFAYGAFRPFDNEPLVLSYTLPRASRVWIFSSPYPIVHPAQWSPTICAQPDYFCILADEFQSSGPHTVRWAGTNSLGGFRADIRHIGVLGRHKLVSRNAILLFGGQPGISNLRAAPTNFAPGSTPLSITFTLATPSGLPVNVTAAIVNQDYQKTLRTVTLSNQAAGLVTLTWDGTSDNGHRVARGGYTAIVTATDAGGNTSRQHVLFTLEY